MIHEFTSNVRFNVENQNSEGANVISKHFHQLITSQHRLTKMFLNQCRTPIVNYSSCLGSDWAENINQFVPNEKRVECFNQWSQIRKCSTKNLGESWTMNLDLHRKLENKELNETTTLNNYNNLINNQLKFLKEDMPGAGDADEE